MESHKKSFNNTFFSQYFYSPSFLMSMIRSTNEVTINEYRMLGETPCDKAHKPT